MSVEIIIPSPGESVTEVTVGSWLKQDGDWVEQDEAICEIESDKATLEVGAPVAGVLNCSAGVGDELDVGSVLGTIEEGEKKPEAKSEPAKKKKKAIDRQAKAYKDLMDKSGNNPQEVLESTQKQVDDIQAKLKELSV